MLKTVRTIGRIIKCIISAETTRYQAALTAKMLGDTAWRSQVYADLGGFFGMYEWRRRFAAARSMSETASIDDQFIASKFDRAAANDIHHNTARNTVRNHNAVKTDRRGQFRLAPIPRPFLSLPRTRLGYAAKQTAHTFISPLSKPIPLHPNVFSSPFKGKPQGHETASERPYDNHENAAQSDDADGTPQNTASQKAEIKPP